MKQPHKIRTRFAIFAIALAPCLASAQFSADIVGYWPLDTDLIDQSTTGADGTFSGTAPLEYGITTGAIAKFGDCIDLDGVDQHIIMDGGGLLNADTFDLGTGSLAPLGGTGAVTVSAWFDSGLGFNTGWQALVAKGEGTNWRVARRGTTDNLAYAGGSGDIFDGGKDVNDVTLHHAVAITDPVFGTSLYIDGVLHGRNTATPNLGNQNGLHLMIGSNPQNVARSWIGCIDDVIVFKSALTPSEAVALYNSGTGVIGQDVLDETDSDTDGLPDWWETVHFGSLAQGAASLVGDADTLTAAQELAAGTSPNLADSDGDGADDDVELSGSANVWTAGTNTGIPGDPTSPNYADSDGDGLSDNDEFIAGTDPNDTDTDNDGVPDGTDTQPLTGAHDTDLDGINNDDEVAGTSNPFPSNAAGSAATGPPGLATNPNNADSDGDSISDGEEIALGVDGFVTNPNQVDTDGDGVNDDAEISLGSDPSDQFDTPSAWYANLTGYWKFDGDTLDSSTTGAHGTFKSSAAAAPGDTAAYTPAKFGDGIDLIPDDREAANVGERWSQRVEIEIATVPEATFDNDGGDLAVSAWFRVDNFDQNWQALVAKGEGGSYRIARRAGATRMGANIGAWATGNANGPDLPTSVIGPVVNDGLFHHVVIITDSVNIGAGGLYVDGTLVQAPDTNAVVLKNSANPLVIGGNNQAAGDANGAYRSWNGVLDDVAIWKRTLSETEIGLIYNNGTGRSIQELIDNPDDDFDGLTNAQELSGSENGAFGNTPTDPQNADSDGDGVNDGKEVLVFSSNPNADDDSDGDGINNLAETNGTLNPWSSGNNSGAPGEPTDPCEVDSDGDSIQDGEEIVAGLDSFVTDPNSADSDGDGFSDSDEIAAGSDPTNGLSLPPIETGLVGYWPFEKNGCEFSPTGADGSFKGNTPPAFIAGPAGLGGFAADLDADNGHHYEIDSVPATTYDFGVVSGGTGNVSISVWFKTGPFGAGGWQGIVSKGEGTNWRVARRAATDWIAYAGGTGDIEDNTANHNDGLWHHAVAITEGGVSTRLWVDNALIATSAGAPTLGNQNLKSMMIGNNPDSTARFFRGAVDEVCIWNRVVQPAEIGALYNGGTGASMASLATIDITKVVGPGGAETIDTFNGAGGLTVSGLEPSRGYMLYRSLDLIIWDPVAGSYFTGGAVNAFNDPAPPAGKAFYSVFDVTP